MFRELLAQPVDEVHLVFFRFLFGLILAIDSVRSRKSLPLLYAWHSDTFPFVPFRWLPRPKNQRLLRWLIDLQTVAFLFFACGWFQPWSTLFAGLIYGYFFVICKSRYNNHYYLILLFLLLFAVSRPVLNQQAHYWQLFLFQAQLLIVYTYAAIAKMNRDWLIKFEPLWFDIQRMRFSTKWGKPETHYVPLEGMKRFCSELFKKRSTAGFLAWSGFLFDLIIIPLLWFEPTRLFALFPYLFFHLFNSWYLQIGAFPWINIAALVLFWNSDALRGVIS